MNVWEADGAEPPAPDDSPRRERRERRQGTIGTVRHKEYAVAEDTRLLQIGEAAERVGLSLRTVRYWEEVGLVTPSARSIGRFRLYSEADVERLLLLKQMKPLGLTLEEMRELADLIEQGERPRELGEQGLRTLVDALNGYAVRADTATEKLERGLSEARQLRLRIGERLGHCQALQDSDGTSPTR